MPETTTTPCPSCGAAASGNFCAACGTRLGASFCPACGGAVKAGARFCGHCGHTLAGGGAATSVTAPPPSRTPWIIAGLLSFITIAGVVYAAGARNRAAAPDMANSGNEAAGGAQSALPAGPAPDISQMTPREQFTRLDDRIMKAAGTGDTTTVITFWPMAAGAYQNLPDSDRDADIRYHMATLHLLIGQFPQTLALADTILAQSPGDLLGYYLRAIVADFQADSTRAREARRQFNQHYDAEMAKSRPEYLDHAPMLKSFRDGSGS